MGFWFGDEDDENAQVSRETGSKENKKASPNNAEANANRKRAAATEGAPSEKKQKTNAEQQPSVDDAERPNNDNGHAAVAAPAPKHSPTLEKKIVDYMTENTRPEGFTYVELRTMIDRTRRIPVDKEVVKASLDYLVQRGRLEKYRLRYYIPTGDSRLRVVVSKTAAKSVVTRISAPAFANAAVQFPAPNPESPRNMETEQDGNAGDNPGVVSTTDNAKPETPKPAPKTDKTNKK